MAQYDFDNIKKETNKSGKLALDIETTGKKKNDKIVAIGYAWKKRDGSVVNGHHALKLFSEDDNVEAVWRREGFELRCFNEFWNTPTQMDILKQLQQGAEVVETEAELAFRLNETLKEAEEHWGGNLQIVTDTTAYDTCWLHRLLVEHDYHALDATRTGKHRWTYDLDSFVLGLLGVTPDTVCWRDMDAFTRLLRKLPVESVPHDHHPANDAKSILADFEAAEIYQGMTRMTALLILAAPDELFEEALDVHITQIKERFSFMQQQK